MLPSKEQIGRSPFIPICGEFITSGGYPLWLLFEKKELFGWNGDAWYFLKNLNNQVVSMFQTRYFWFWKRGKPACLNNPLVSRMKFTCEHSNYLPWPLNQYIFSCNMFKHGVLFSITSILLCQSVGIHICHLQSFLCINVNIHKYQKVMLQTYPKKVKKEHPEIQ